MLEVIQFVMTIITIDIIVDVLFSSTPTPEAS